MWAGEADNLETRAGNKKVEAKSKAPHAKPAYGPKVTATGSALGGKTPEALPLGLSASLPGTASSGRNLERSPPGIRLLGRQGVSNWGAACKEQRFS